MTNPKHQDPACPVCQRPLELDHHEYPLSANYAPLGDPYARYVCGNPACPESPECDTSEEEDHQ